MFCLLVNVIHHQDSTWICLEEVRDGERRRNERKKRDRVVHQKQPGLIKTRTSVHFLCDTVYVPYCTFHRSFKEKCPLSGAKTHVKYMNPGMFLLRRYSYILLFLLRRYRYI